MILSSILIRVHVDKFAQCETCLSWLSNQKCFILDRVVSADASCDMYLPGKADPSWLDAREIFIPDEVGLVTRQVRCENCASFNLGRSICNLFDRLNKAFPDIFDLAVNVDPRGCCNGQTPVRKVSKAQSFSDIMKGSPDVGDVHVPAALSAAKKKPNDFSAFINPTNKPKPEDDPEVVLPKTDSVNKGLPTGESGYSGGTSGPTGYPRRQHLKRRRFSKATSFDEAMAIKKKSGALVGLAAAVNLVHHGSPFEQKPKKLKYGTKTYRLDVKKKVEEDKREEDLDKSFKKLALYLNALGKGIE